MSAVHPLGEWRELVGLTVSDLREELRRTQRVRAVLDARVIEIASLIDAMSIDGTATERAVAEVELIEHGGLSRRDAAVVMRRSHVIDDNPLLGSALASAEVAVGHVDAIVRGLKIIDDARGPFLALVPGLVDLAKTTSVGEFTSQVLRIAKGVVTDGGLSAFENQRRSTFLKIWNDAEGMVNLQGKFDPEMGAIVQSRLNAQVEEMFHSGDRGVAISHHAWIEPIDHRRAHALIALLTSNSSTECSSVRHRVDVIVHIDLETLTLGLRESSTHRTVFGADVPVETIRRMACEGQIIPVVLNGAGVPVDVGRGQRLATAAQRRALEAVHTTCTMPGCEVAYHMCQIHHIHYWERGGATDLDNMVPLCSHHHRAAHEGGWTLRLREGTRQLEAVPP